MNLFVCEGNYLKSQNTEKFQKKIFNDFIKYKNFETLNHNEIEMKRLFNNKNTILISIIKENYVIGYLMGEFLNLGEISLLDERSVFYITYIFIEKNYRDRKYGQKLINKLYSFIKTKNYIIDGYMLRFNYNDEKLKYFYEKNNFFKDLILSTNSEFDIFFKKM